MTVGAPCLVPTPPLQETPSYTCTLTRLDVRSNDIGAAGVAAITTALTSSGNHTLTSLSLNGNAIGDEGGLAIAALLAVGAR